MMLSDLCSFFAGASDNEIERLLVRSSEFELDWEELMSERQSGDELWLYQTTKEAPEEVSGSGFAMIREEHAAFSFTVLTLPVPARISLNGFKVA